MEHNGENLGKALATSGRAAVRIGYLSIIVTVFNEGMGLLLD